MNTHRFYLFNIYLLH